MTQACKTVVIFLLLNPALLAEACPRPGSGSAAAQPPEVTSSHGQLQVSFSFRSDVDDDGLTRYCYVYGDGMQSPTLRVKPGDEVILNLRNDLMPSGSPAERHPMTGCSAGPMTAVSTNLHFHGLEIAPVCHQDDVIHTLVQPSEPAFQYRFRIPAGQPPGLYWYHPHPHGFSEAQVLGGASGALIVDGIADRKPQVRGLPERVLVLRDQINPVAQYRSKTRPGDDEAGAKDISVNYVPIVHPLFQPAVMRVPAARREFWRVLNASADTYFRLQVLEVENGQRVAHPLQLIAIDGAPVADAATNAPTTELLIPPGARAEFAVTTPRAGALAQLVTANYDTGPDGAANPYKVIANILSTGAPESGAPTTAAPESGWRFSGLSGIKPARLRKLYFSEEVKTPGQPAKYFITVEGKEPAVFDMNFRRPDITVRQGDVEDWIVENRAREAHVFHIHQVHFQVIERDGVAVNEPMLRDTVDLPYQKDKSAPYPSVKLRMDFRSPDIMGTFLFHCHILEHEDAGMMGSIEVVRQVKSGRAGYRRLRNDPASRHSGP